MLRLILVGGGHAQLSVLRALAKQRLNVEAVLVTPSAYQIYSGMLPGWIAGHYSMDECRIDLRPLAQAAHVQLLLATVVGIDAQRDVVKLADGATLDYDLLSIDVGSETDTSWLQAADERLLPIKPLNEFVQRWPDIVSSAAQKRDYHLAIVGGGAAGVELAFAARYAFNLKAINAQVTLVASENGLLPGHAASVKARAQKRLQQQGIRLCQAQAVGAADGLQLATGEKLQADCVIAATSARPTAWLANTGLARDEQGYLSVDAQHRSVSHANVFAAGDVCVREDIRLPRSGVHAVFAGPIVANNLLATLTGNALQRYRPRKKSLYLLATGAQYAIASWGRFSAQGHWVWRWKNWIDQRFMRNNRIQKKSPA
ncbi:MAG: FAD-dependent oxidoreductase [Gallionella sp.]